LAAVKDRLVFWCSATAIVVAFLVGMHGCLAEDPDGVAQAVDHAAKE
jgi:hypothetical protein